MTLIGISGKIGSGKTICGEHLVLRYNYTNRNLADPLKEACVALFLLSPDQVNGTQDDKNKPDPNWFNCAPRKMLQFIGTDLLRNQLDKIMPGIQENIFVNHMRIWYNRFITENPDGKVVISDVRNLNEAEFIKNLGGIIIKLARDTPYADSHISENMIDMIKADYDIDNNGNLIELYRKLDEIIFETTKLSNTNRSNTKLSNTKLSNTNIN